MNIVMVGLYGEIGVSFMEEFMQAETTHWTNSGKESRNPTEGITDEQ